MTPALAFLLLGTLFDQSIEKVMNQQFPDPALSYVVLDSVAGKVIAQRWKNADRPVPVGSLVKPFLALAASRAGQFPEYTCNPKQCWLPRGHGSIGITQAIAHSCNSYFLQIASKADPDFLSRFGLTSPPRNASAQTWIGLGREWKLSPLAVVEAYRMLAANPQAEPIRAGMLRSSQTGTGKAFGRKTMVKTGTAPCSHVAELPGDGYVVAITPKVTLLVQMHGAPGAVVAATGGKMLRVLLDGK